MVIDFKRHKNTVFSETLNLVLGNRRFSKTGPVVMGILNLTPDSFYDGSRYPDQKSMLQAAEKMLIQGAAIIDVGAASTRPGAVAISAEEEIKRLVGNLRMLVKMFPDVIISVDTYHASVAEAAIDEGAMMINDISGGMFDPAMLDFIGSHNIPYILMHTTDSPDRMMHNPLGSEAVEVVKAFFDKQLPLLRQKGGHQVILDPGFGFGKSVEGNYLLLKNLGELRVEGLPIMAGLSRKSLVNKVLNTSAGEALNGSTVLHTIALLQGAQILRVHDVKEAVEVVNLCRQFDGV